MSTRETVEIGGTTYRIAKFDAFSALKILGDLQKQFMAPLFGVLDGREAGSQEAVTAGLMQGIERVSRDMDGDKLVAMAKRLLSSEHILVDWQGDTRKLDQGMIAVVLQDVADVLELCIAVVRVNFENVFTRAANLIGAARLQTSTPESSGLPAASQMN